MEPQREHETSYAQIYLDPELNHSSGYFLDGETSLAAAQQAKVDAILSGSRLSPGMRVLDAGCGWGATARAAARQYGVHVTGITLSGEQYDYACAREKDDPSEPGIEYRIQSWETFTEPVDRIICVNAFENFDDKEGFLHRSRELLPPGGVTKILTVTADRPMFRVMSKGEIERIGRSAGYTVQTSDSLTVHYARTLDHFAANLIQRREAAEAVVGADRLTGTIAYYRRCAQFLRSGLNNMYEFTLVAC